MSGRTVNFGTPRWMKRAARLPSPPQILLRLMNMLVDDRTPLSDVKRLIETDPALTARLLAFANSAPIRRAGPRVGTIDRAVRALGTQNLYRLLTTVGAQALRTKRVPGYGMDRYALWRHSLRAAVAAEDVAQYVPEVEWSEAYAAGLLLDVGKLILGPEIRDRLDEVRDIMEGEDPPAFDAVERRLFGIDHATIGADLARSWNLPPSLETAIRYHHAPHRAPADQELVYVCHVADFLAMAAGSPGSVDELTYFIDETWREVVPLRDDQLHALLIQIEERVESIMDLLDA